VGFGVSSTAGAVVFVGSGSGVGSSASGSAVGVAPHAAKATLAALAAAVNKKFLRVIFFTICTSSFEIYNIEMT